MKFNEHIRVIADFPKEGISYKDITTLLKNGDVYRAAVNEMVEKLSLGNLRLLLDQKPGDFY